MIIMKNKMVLTLTCEHGGNEVPEQYAGYFKDAAGILQTHRGYDIGALELFQTLCELNHDYSIYSTTTRLLIDLNRSLHRKTLFSEFTIDLDATIKQEILDKYYHPYRNSYLKKIEGLINNNNKVIQLSVHSFTPVLNGVERNTDIGVLYHPGRPSEVNFARVFKSALMQYLPHLKIRFNYPYLGKPDGHVAFFRKIYSDEQYEGIELELNQMHAFNEQIYTGIKKALQDTMNTL